MPLHRILVASDGLSRGGGVSKASDGLSRGGGVSTPTSRHYSWRVAHQRIFVENRTRCDESRICLYAVTDFKAVSSSERRSL